MDDGCWLDEVVDREEDMKRQVAIQPKRAAVRLYWAWFGSGSLLLAGLAANASWVVPISAHSGGLAADGCHMDRQSGQRHCHRAQAQTEQARDSGNSSGDTYYPNCDAARRAGAAPVRRGQPGYGRHLDRDGDGVGCE